MMMIIAIKMISMIGQNTTNNFLFVFVYVIHPSISVISVLFPLRGSISALWISAAGSMQIAQHGYKEDETGS